MISERSYDTEESSAPKSMNKIARSKKNPNYFTLIKVLPHLSNMLTSNSAVIKLRIFMFRALFFMTHESVSYMYKVPNHFRQKLPM